MPRLLDRLVVEAAVGLLDRMEPVGMAAAQIARRYLLPLEVAAAQTILWARSVELVHHQQVALVVRDQQGSRAER
jgi:hypothetical protein